MRAPDLTASSPRAKPTIAVGRGRFVPGRWARLAGSLAVAALWLAGPAPLLRGAQSLSEHGVLAEPALLPVGTVDGSASTGLEVSSDGARTRSHLESRMLLYRGAPSEGPGEHGTVDVFVRGAPPGATVVLRLYVGFAAALDDEGGTPFKSGTVDPAGRFQHSFDRAALGLDDPALLGARVITMRAVALDPSTEQGAVYSNVALLTETPALLLLLESLDGAQPSRLVRFDPVLGEISAVAGDVALPREPSPSAGQPGSVPRFECDDAARFAVAGPRRGLFYESLDFPEFLLYDDPEDDQDARAISTLTGHEVLDVVCTPDRGSLLVLSATHERADGTEFVRTQLHLSLYDALGVGVLGTQGVLRQSVEVGTALDLGVSSLTTDSGSRRVFVSYAAHGVDRMQEYLLGDHLVRGRSFAPSPRPAEERVRELRTSGNLLATLCERLGENASRIVVFDLLEACKVLDVELPGRPLDLCFDSPDSLLVLCDAELGTVERFGGRSFAERTRFSVPGAQRLVADPEDSARWAAVGVRDGRVEARSFEWWDGEWRPWALAPSSAQRGPLVGAGLVGGAGGRWLYAVQRSGEAPSRDTLIWWPLDGSAQATPRIGSGTAGGALSATDPGPPPRELPLGAVVRRIR